MAFSPREELRIDSLVVFAHFEGGWVWAERSLDGSTVLYSATKSFDSLAEAVEDFLRDVGVDLRAAPEDAHYSELHQAAEDEWHIRKYVYGAPDPLRVAVIG